MMGQIRTTAVTGAGKRWLAGLAVVLFLSAPLIAESVAHPVNPIAPDSTRTQRVELPTEVAMLPTNEPIAARASRFDRPFVLPPIMESTVESSPRAVAQPVAVSTPVDPAPGGFALVTTGLGILFLVYRFRYRLLR